MPAIERHRAQGIRQANLLVQRVGREVRDLRLAAGLSQARLAGAAGVSRQWLSRLELGRLPTVDLRRVALVYAPLGHKVVLTAYPVGEPIRDAAQLRLLTRFNTRLSPAWQRITESVMPGRGDLRAWDELLRGPVRIGVEAETRPSDLQALERSISAKQRDSGVGRVVLVVASTARNRRVVRDNIATLRQCYPLDSRATLAALEAGRDPGANGLVLI